MGPSLHVPASYSLPGLPGAVPTGPMGMPGSPSGIPGGTSGDGPSRSFGQVLRHNRNLIIACVVIALVLGTVYLFTATRYYAATAELSVVRGAAPGAEAAVAAQTGNDYLYTQREIILSTPVLALAAQKVDPGDQMRTFHEVHNRVGWLKRQLSVDVGKADQVIALELQSTDGLEAQQILASIVACYQQSQNDQEQRMIDDKCHIYQSKKTGIDRELDTKQKQLDDLRRIESEPTLTAQGATLEMQRAGALSTALVNAEVDTVQAKASFIQAARSAGGIVGKDAAQAGWNPDPDTERVNAAASPPPMDPDAARSEEIQLRQQLSLLQRQYMPGYPAIQATQARLDDVEAAIVNSARMKWLAAVDREHDLQTAYNDLQKVALKQGTAASEYQRLQADVDRLQGQSDSLDKTIRDLSYGVQAASVTINPIEPAELQDGVAAPRALKVYPIALLCGLAGGIGIGLLRPGAGATAAARKVRRTSDGKAEMLGLPVLAALARQAEAPLKTLAWSTYLRPESPLAQSFKTLQQVIETPLQPGENGAAAVNLNQARTIMVASAVAGEGRTSTASNLAIALAGAGRRVCLVDADFRSPALVKIFQGREQTGFSNVLAGVDTIAGAVCHTQIERMDLLASGLTPRDPAALLNSDRLSETLEDLTMSYDVVILDTPPVLASPDARIIAASCDATLLIVGTDASSRRFAEQGRDNLQAVGAQIAGIITNQAPKRTGRGMDDGGRPKPPVSVETHAPTAAVGGMREKRGA